MLTSSILTACSSSCLEYKSFIVGIDINKVDDKKDIRIISNFEQFQGYQSEERTQDYVNEQVLLAHLKYNEAYFENKDLIIVLHTSSSSYTYKPKHIEINNGNINIVIKSNRPSIVNMDIIVWLIYIELEKLAEEFNSITYQIIK